MPAPRDAGPGAQTCCALKSSAPSGARQDNYADSGSACKLAQDIPPDGAHSKRCAFPRLYPWLCAWLESVCVSSRWKVLSGEFRRRPTALAKKIVNWIVSVAEDCLSPERTFHGCALMHFRGCIRGRYFIRTSPLPFSTKPIIEGFSPDRFNFFIMLCAYFGRAMIVYPIPILNTRNISASSTPPHC